MDGKPTSLRDIGSGGKGWRAFVASHEKGNSSNDAFMLHLGNLRAAPTFGVDVVSHCNLNCASCYHFSPAAEPSFLSLDDYARNLRLIARVDGLAEYLDAICLMGGEPLLHPELPSFIRLALELVPGARVRVVTNGLLLASMGDTFWEAMRLPKAQLLMTPYPTGLDYEALAAYARGQGAHVVVGGGLAYADGDACFLRAPLDETASQDPMRSFVECPLGGSTMQLIDGKVFPCDRGALFGILNERFGTSFAHEEDDYLELYTIASADEVDAFRRKAHPMCRYCANALAERILWHRSEVDKFEWLMRPEEYGA